MTAHEEYLKKIYNLVGNEYTVLSNYVNAKTKVKMKHNRCGHEWDIRAGNFIIGRRCPNCRTRLKSLNKFKSEVEELVSNEYTLLEDYIDDKTKILFKHAICGHVYKATPRTFLTGHRCPNCANKGRSQKLSKTDSTFKWEVEVTTEGEYAVVGDYINSYTRVKMRHNSCGHEWAVNPNTFIVTGTRCPKCAYRNKGLKLKYTQEEFELMVLEEGGGEYTVLGTYKNNVTKIKMRHNICGLEWDTRPSGFIAEGKRCPNCRNSRGERLIEKYLNFNNFRYKSEFWFSDLLGLGGRPLRFDFALLNERDEIITLVEFDGQQHYLETNTWRGKDLKRTQAHDCLKNQYCIDNNISLIRIPYWEKDNIDKVLDEDLKELGVIRQ